jgi:hypothetical protein
VKRLALAVVACVIVLAACSTDSSTYSATSYTPIGTWVPKNSNTGMSSLTLNSDLSYTLVYSDSASTTETGTFTYTAPSDATTYSDTQYEFTLTSSSSVETVHSYVFTYAGEMSIDSWGLFKRKS